MGFTEQGRSRDSDPENDEGEDSGSPIEMTLVNRRAKDGQGSRKKRQGKRRTDSSSGQEEKELTLYEQNDDLEGSQTK